MSYNEELSEQNEKVAAGILGAFLFALIGGALYIALYKIDIFPPVSGMAAIVLSIIGFRLFGKKPSLKSVFVPMLITVVVIVLAIYLTLAWDAYEVYAIWYENGESERSITAGQALLYGYQFLADPGILTYYVKQFGLTFLFCIVGSVLFIIDGIKLYREQRDY